ncbi:hypothetical protein Tco_0590699 [Tanacetum coccineum]
MMKQKTMNQQKEVGKRKDKKIARKGMHTSVDENVSDDSDKVDEQEETNTGTETPLNPVPSISRDDLTELYRIVMNRYGLDGPEDKLEKGFWKCLRIMFEEPLSTDSIWSEIEQQKIKISTSAEVCKTIVENVVFDGKMNEDAIDCENDGKTRQALEVMKCVG